LLGKTSGHKDFYRREGGRYTDSFEFGLDKLALSLTPPDVQRYPTGNAVKNFLMAGVRYLQLNSVAMRQPTPATRPAELSLDGTNLARVVGNLIRNGGSTAGKLEGARAMERWTEHLRYALENLESIQWAKRESDNAEYLVLRFAGGLECPSWLLSDGTLRMLALTLPAFLPGGDRVYMVEEPENGVHPQALEIILKALQAIPSAQVFVATHSPLVVQQAGVAPLLCFTRDERKGVAIVHGAKHPALRDWTGSPDLATIFASRVLG
jgi:predicted ATPase